MSTPVVLYKILSTEAWALSEKIIHLSSADASFIHFSTEGQLKEVIKKHWSRVPEYMILTIDPVKLPGRLVLENNRGKTDKYYHLYEGCIPKEAVTFAEFSKKSFYSPF